MIDGKRATERADVETLRGVVQRTHGHRGALFHLVGKHQPPLVVACAVGLLLLPFSIVAAVLLLLVRLCLRVERVSTQAAARLPAALHHPLGLAQEWAELSDAELRTLESRERTQPDARAAETPNPSWQFPSALDVGVYWYGPQNSCSAGPDSVHFKRSRPSVLYVHGWQPGTTQRGFRETINWVSGPGSKKPGPLPDAFPVDAWLRTHNVGIFYWSQLSDEPVLDEAERKIYNCVDGARMRWRRQNRDGSVAFVRDAELDKSCVADKLAAAYVQHFSCTGGAGPVHLVGHSLGAQLVLEALRRLLTHHAAHPRSRGPLLPRRLTLLDPSFARGRREYAPLCGVSTAARGGETVNLLRDALPLLAVETYETSLVGAGAFGDVCPRLRARTCFAVVDAMQFSWLNVPLRHVSAPFLYFCSGVPLLPDLAGSWQAARFNAAVPYEALLAQMPAHPLPDLHPLQDSSSGPEALLAAAAALAAS